MSNRSSSLEETFYGNCASLYDVVATAPGIRGWREHTVETLSLSPGDTVVEMGCGTGANLPFLRRAVGSEGTVIGIDLVRGMLDRAHKRVERHGWENVHLIQGDATTPPIDSADALVSTFVIGMLTDPASAVRTWMNTVEPGGRVTLLNAARTNRLVARPLNLPCRLFVRLTAPGYQLRADSPVKRLEERWVDASEALFEGTTSHVDERLGAGFITLASGEVIGETG